ncbi:MAG: hypothetical protein A2020_03150 [Lentisphaerae bacterium GWF2_45_14]|nr:MAG: hypothetical protein A2020_03150 [Lentisphaerae bacterium GWF2_45_14]
MKSVIAAITLTAFTAFAQDAPQTETEIPADKLRQSVELFKTQNVEDIPLLKEYQDKARSLKAQFDELLPKVKEQQQKVKEADKVYSRASVPPMTTSANREKIGWHYEGYTKVHSMEGYKEARKAHRKIEFVYKEVDSAAEKQAAKVKLADAKKALFATKAQMQKLREDYRANALKYKAAVEKMLTSVEGKSATTASDAKH